MTVQQALAYAGVACFVVAGVLVALAVRCYRAEDIRGVCDDLSGRRRQQRIAAVVCDGRTSFGPSTVAHVCPLPEEAVVLASRADSGSLDVVTMSEESDEDALA